MGVRFDAGECFQAAEAVADGAAILTEIIRDGAFGGFGEFQAKEETKPADFTDALFAIFADGTVKEAGSDLAIVGDVFDDGGEGVAEARFVSESDFCAARRQGGGVGFESGGRAMAIDEELQVVEEILEGRHISGEW